MIGLESQQRVVQRLIKWRQVLNRFTEQSSGQFDVKNAKMIDIDHQPEPSSLEQPLYAVAVPMGLQSPPRYIQIETMQCHDRRLPC